MDDLSRAIDAVRRNLPKALFELDEPLKNHTTFKIGGPVRAMFYPEEIECLAEMCNILSECEITPFIMGNGSNILASDKKLDIIVINTTRINGTQMTGEMEIKVEAGALLSKVAVFACEHGLTGLEFAHGIPGTIGGAVVMNAGAYGGEMKDVVYSTTAYNAGNGIFAAVGEQHEFSYRHSRFSNTSDVILSSVVRLQRDEKKAIKQRMEELNNRRHQSQPLDMLSAGSTFKRPKEGYAAALIEKADLKGYMVGGAAVSEKHAGFIVNRGDATFTDVLAVVDHVQEVVLKQFGVQLELEVKVLS